MTPGQHWNAKSNVCYGGGCWTVFAKPFGQSMRVFGLCFITSLKTERDRERKAGHVHLLWLFLNWPCIVPPLSIVCIMSLLVCWLDLGCYLVVHWLSLSDPLVVSWLFLGCPLVVDWLSTLVSPLIIIILSLVVPCWVEGKQWNRKPPDFYHTFLLHNIGK